MSLPQNSNSPGAEDVFAKGAYWREYYSSLGHENREVGEFLLEAATSISPMGGLTILDAGCGPTLLYWAVFIPGRNEILGFDLNPANVLAIKRQIDDVYGGVYDAGLMEAATHAIRAMSANAEPEAHLADKARQVGTLSVADLSQRWPYETQQFDFVQSCFSFEQLPDWESFDAALAQANRVLRPGGCMVLVNTAQGTNWNCDNHRFPTLFVTPGDLRGRIEHAGLQLQSMREVDSTDIDRRAQGYDKVLLTSALKIAVA